MRFDEFLCREVFYMPIPEPWLFVPNALVTTILLNAFIFFYMLAVFTKIRPSFSFQWCFLLSTT